MAPVLSDLPISSELPQIQAMCANPMNNQLAGVPSPELIEQERYQQMLVKRDQSLLEFLIILPYHTQDQWQPWNFPYPVDGGTIIGYIQLYPEGYNRSIEVGGFDSGEFAGSGYGAEAFEGMFEFARNILRRTDVFLETMQRNQPFINMMERLYLGQYEDPLREEEVYGEMNRV
ncbi:uncharacterized protein PAC_14466 [Phialocephala subalpina]|uniref:N-acetyltransferase domain-containing protein n=1 Tax=Phialocephala subalpina TaxID=576137 RepID=A0A1L7XHS9_9HELO|nr:uncharacterized protein PAC_14466 [Phialocephala subalpina]